MNADLLRKAEELAADSYVVVVSKEDLAGKSFFMARTPELYGCMAEGSSEEEARANLKDARVEYIYSLLKDNLRVPRPTHVTLTTVQTPFSVEDDGLNIVETISFNKVLGKKKSLYQVSINC
jgi:predicted RNase H-like HicB family nuclease